jgi:hypothetical protein
MLPWALKVDQWGGGLMDRGAKKAAAQAEAVRNAAAAGDPAAMWQYTLILLNLQYDDRREGLTSFLVRVSEVQEKERNAEAASLIDRAAQAGHPHALFVAAGLVETSDPERARELLGRAAAQGDVPSMRYLATILPAGPEAVHWLTKVAESGEVGGMYQLSKLLAASDPAAAQAWLVKAADGGNTKAQNDVGVLAFDSGTRPLDPARPSAADPRRTGLFGPKTPTSRQDRVVADCVKCAERTVQDHYELIVGKWVGLRGPGTTGKTGHRVHFSACTICGCLFPADDAARDYARLKGGEFFNPAKLHQPG